MKKIIREMKKQQREIGNEENHLRKEKTKTKKTIGNEENHKKNEETHAKINRK